MEFVVRQVALRNDEAEELRQIKVFDNREEASEFAKDCALEELSYDGPYGSNSYVGDMAFEVQPYDETGPYYVCDSYDIVKGHMTAWHGGIKKV